MKIKTEEIRERIRAAICTAHPVCRGHELLVKRLTPLFLRLHEESNEAAKRILLCRRCGDKTFFDPELLGNPLSSEELSHLLKERDSD